MSSVGFLKCAGALAALTMCAACGAGSAGPPSTAGPDIRYVGQMLFLNGRPVTAAHLSPVPRYATLVPYAQKKAKDYEYVFNNYHTYATILDYPKSVAQIGSIEGDGGQGCTNVLYGYGKKIMWNVGGETQITEYKVPKTPIKTLSVGYSFPTSCAMNAAGDLAVGVFYETGKGGGEVVIFKNASEPGKVYPTPLAAEYFDGYDPQGNLFADGLNPSGSFELIELPKGSSKFEGIRTSNAVKFPGSVQWDGTYLTVFDQVAGRFYRYTISGTKATLKDTITISGAGDCAQTWIVQGLVYCGDAGNDGGEVFNYPAGGSAAAVFKGSFDSPLGVVAAQK